MTTSLKPWESSPLENTSSILRQSSNLPSTSTLRPSSTPPILPPRPQSMSFTNSGYSSLSPYSGYGGYNSYGSIPYSSNYYGGMGNYGGYGYNSYGGYSYGNNLGAAHGSNDAERRFIQFAEDSSRNTFANVENIVRAFNSIAMMLDNTFFAMTSSFRAVLSVAENFGRLRSIFAHIWHAINIFRLYRWLHRKLLQITGRPIPASARSLAWNEATNGLLAEANANSLPSGGASGGSSWPTLAFLGAVISIPYLISKLLPKYEDTLDPEKWKSYGIPAKAAFDFASSSPNELTLHTNDEIILAPKSIQEEMKLVNTGWAYATCNGRCGVIPLNYIVTVKKQPNRAIQEETLSKPRSSFTHKSQKRVSFGENQIIEEDTERILKKVSSIGIKDIPIAPTEDEINVKSVENEIAKVESATGTIENVSQVTEKISDVQPDVSFGEVEKSASD